MLVAEAELLLLVALLPVVALVPVELVLVLYAAHAVALRYCL